MQITVYGTTTATLTYSQPVLLSDVLKEHGFLLSMPCAGHHTCGKCRVRVSGAVSAITPAEEALLGAAPAGTRLACFAYAEGDCCVWLADTRAAVQAEGMVSAFSLTPGVGVGFAVDIGTTTVAVYAYRLADGTLLARKGMANPQAAYGGDVLSRIEAAIAGKGPALAQGIAGALIGLFDDICREHGIAPAEVTRAVVTGNTTMLYLLLQQDVRCLAAAPFAIEDYLGRWYPAAALGLAGYDRLSVYLPRTIEAFVGSDITCALTACTDWMHTSSAALMVDIGTNGEMAIRRGDTLVCCSTAAGPAFEGAGISMGCMAQPGAIQRVWLEEGRICHTTVGDVPATGVCGSGLIDALAVFLQCGLVDESGYIDADAADERYRDLVEERAEGTALTIPGTAVSITQDDVRAIQLAKSAICAGMYSLMHACDITEDGVDTLLLAGGFGSYVDAENAARIGLIPKALAAKARPVGNAAGMGACALLLSDEARERSVSLAQQAHCLALSTSDYFMERYVDGMFF